MNGVLTSAPASRQSPNWHRRPSRQPQPLPEWVQFTAVLLCVLQFCGQINTYDERNRKKTEQQPTVLDATTMTTSRPMLTWGYDAAGNVTSTIDARGNASTGYETTMTYDAANRVTDVIAPAVPLGTGSAYPRTHTDYDADGNAIYVYNANDTVACGGTFGGHAPCTTNVYDLLNRLVTTTDEAGITVTNTYDSVGNKTMVQDGNLHTTSFCYDGLNRLRTTIDMAGNRTTLHYDALNKTQRVDALSQITTYYYDVRNRLSSVVYSPTTAINSERDYAYDYDGNLLSVTEPSKTAANVGYTYDALNRVITETVAAAVPSGGTLTHIYTYDPAGNRLTTTYGGTGRTIIVSVPRSAILTTDFR